MVYNRHIQFQISEIKGDKIMKPVYLCILDGVAIGAKNKTNAVFEAMAEGKAPFLKELFAKQYGLLGCSGRAVGLPDGTMGNSEVNHLNMGAGRVVYQSIERINVAIEDGSFFTNHGLLKAVNNCKAKNSTLHLMGIIQGHGGTVHGHINHLFALLKLAKDNGLKKIAIHIFGDGRDTDPYSLGEVYIKMLQDEILSLGMKEIASVKTIMGREIAMDRDTAWGKTLIAMKAIILGETESVAGSADEAIKKSYEQKSTDEFIRPVKIGEYDGVKKEDSIIFWNYRQDRAMQLAVGFCEQDHKFFNYKKGVKPIDESLYSQIIELQNKIKGSVFVSMTEYYEGTASLTAFPEKEIPHTVGEVVSNAGLLQLRIAGTEKFAHVTGWFSGRRQNPFNGEERVLIQDPTLKDRTEQGKRYDLVPEMTAYLETDRVLSEIDSKNYSLIVHNFQNGDMVGHTGNLEAATKAISVVSECLSRIVPKWLEKGGVFILTADHGNADEMIVEKNHNPVASTQHSLNPVPVWILGVDGEVKDGAIPDIGVTILKVMGLHVPADMNAKSLI